VQGLDSKELMDLSRSIGNNVSGYTPNLKPREVATLLQKAIDNGNSIGDIAQFLLERSNIKTLASGNTMVSRTLRLFKKLDSSLHESVVYKTYSSADKDVSTSISFQSAVELTRFKLEDQKSVFETIIKNNLKKEDIKTMLHLVTVVGMTNREAAIEINKDKGISDYQIIVHEIDLNKMNQKLYTMSSIERNEVFNLIFDKICNFKYSDLRLGAATYSFTYGERNKTIPQTELTEFIENLDKEIINYE
jgi:hypothetical protein